MEPYDTVFTPVYSFPSSSLSVYLHPPNTRTHPLLTPHIHPLFHAFHLKVKSEILMRLAPHSHTRTSQHHRRRVKVNDTHAQKVILDLNEKCKGMNISKCSIVHSSSRTMYSCKENWVTVEHHVQSGREHYFRLFAHQSQLQPQCTILIRKKMLWLYCNMINRPVGK
jgi:hypothetical protein